MSFHSTLRGRDLHSPSRELVANQSGTLIEKLRCITFVSQPGSLPLVQKISNSVTQVIRGVTEQSIPNGEAGFATSLGFMNNVDTSPWTVGTRLYSDNTGALTPTSLGLPTSLPIATVLRQSATEGIMYIDNTGITLAELSSTDAFRWKILGNAGTDSDIHFLGTTDPEGLSFRTNNVRRIKVDETGKVLFGDFSQPNPEYFFHLKQHSGFLGSGHMKETAALQVVGLGYQVLYSLNVNDNCVVTGTFRITAVQQNNAAQASFVRSGTWYKTTAPVQRMGILQSDFTNKSNIDFDLKIEEIGSQVIISVRNANPTSTKWLITALLDIMPDS